MTRVWAPLFKDVQVAIRTAILAERTVQSASLPAGLRGDDFAVAVAVDSDAPPSKPFTVSILPAERSTFVPEVSRGLEASPLEFRLVVILRAGQEAEKLTLIREVVGLIMDALDADPTFGGLCGGFANPALLVQDVVGEPGVVQQEVLARFVVRG